MIRNKIFLIAYKLFFALLGFSAIVTEIATIVERGRFNLVNFFSYFTIETNLLVVITLLLSALFVAAGKGGKLDVLRSAVTAYILIVGIGFAALLSTMEGLVLTAVPWDNVVLHYVLPVAVLIDLVIDRPKRSLSFRNSLAWLLFPIVYAIYSLTRGAITGWYPYPFLDPATNGYGAVAATMIGLLALGVALIWVVRKLSSNKKR